jgi:hypothetical protein
MAFSATTPTGTSFADPNEWYDQYLADLTALGGTLAQEEYVPYGGPRVAEWTPDQLDAFARTRDAADMWKPYVDPAMAAINAGRGGLDQMRQMTQNSATFNRGTPAYQGGQQPFGPIDGMYSRGSMGQTPVDMGTPTGIDTFHEDGSSWSSGYQRPQGGLNYGVFEDVYMNPVRQMQAAADSIGQRNFQNTTLKNLSDQFTGTGQFGSGRHQILGADAAAQAQAQIEEAKATMGMQATQNAMGDYQKWAQQGLSAADRMGNYAQKQAQTGTDLMNFGLANQQAAMMDAASIGNIGQQQQTQNQQNLNMAYQDFQDQQNFPWQQLSKWSSLTRGGAIPNYNSQVTTPQVTPTTLQNPWMSALQGGAGGWQLGSSFGG